MNRPPASRKKLRVKVKSARGIAKPVPKGPALPPPTDWRTTDEDEIRKRQARARNESFSILNLFPEHPVFSNFEVGSGSGLTYGVELRDVLSRSFSCTCTDFRINGLGTCKHVEAVLLHLRLKKRVAFKGAEKVPSPRIDLVPSADGAGLRVERGLDKLAPSLRGQFDDHGLQLPGADLREIMQAAVDLGDPAIRLSQDIEPALKAAARREQRVILQREYEVGVRAGRHPEHVTLSPLFPYQREGMLHLAFGERALLADEMGLGKTIQGIAACALLHHLGKARRVLVVTPASLKAEWEEQIQRFTRLPLRLIYGRRTARASAYAEPDPPFFTICNYEQILQDSLDINQSLRPDIIVLDEAQRIKNWSTKVAQAVKRLESPYAFVLSGTPLENRIDELRSLVDFLDPTVLGPLFRFNREYYNLDEKGRPESYKNLDKLRERVAPLILRRRKIDVETELPSRTDRNLLVPLTSKMRDEYASYEKQVAELVQRAHKRPLTPKEQDLLMILMAMMRMVCDTPSIIKGNTCEDCPKLEELAKVLEECLSDPEVKVIIFSEWEGMLKRVRTLAQDSGIGYAWHTGSVSQVKRRAEILEFRTNPDCRLFLSTDSGSVGLNLQNASVVINCDLPWNPAKLEQRIARAWRKNQRRAVTVVNLIAEKTIEHGMLGTLANKRNLADGILDGQGNLAEVKLRDGGQSLLKRLEQFMAAPAATETAAISRLRAAADPSRGFAERAKAKLGELLPVCEERWIPGRETPVILAVVAGDAESKRQELTSLFSKMEWGASRPDLQVLDTQTWDAMESLAKLGLVTIHSRARRSLLDSGTPDSAPDEAQIQAIREAKTVLEKRLRAARALLQADLAEEALPHLRDALTYKARIKALEGHYTPPEEFADLLVPPLVSLWTTEQAEALQALGGDTLEMNLAMKLLQIAAEDG